ncbi:MAG: S41 family peptidase [Myxococcota bacterium]
MLTLKVIVVLSTLTAAPADSKLPPDVRATVTDFYDRMFEVLKAEYIFRDSVAWPRIHQAVMEKALKEENFDDAVSHSADVFDAIKCDHCLLFTESFRLSGTLSKPISADDFSTNFLKRYEQRPKFDVRLVDGNVGYILIPGMLLIDLTREQLDAETQRLYDQIAGLMRRSKPVGWIVDLRFNVGGNVYPMLAALHPLLGDGVCYRTLDRNQKPMDDHSLKGGVFYSGDRSETGAVLSVKPDRAVPVAVIIGGMTGSAGEDIAVAFKTRPATRFIGETTYGFLTANELTDLPGNSQMAYTTSYVADAKNVYRPVIEPDVRVTKKDNFKAFLQDGNIIEALRFIRSQRKDSH